MNVLDHFSVPYLGLKDGMHEFNFEVDDAFFKEFESTLVSSGRFIVRLELDKRPDMGEALFYIDGEVTVDCDRCLQPVRLFIEEDVRMHIKYGESNLDEDEVMFIEPDTSIINFAQIIYEYICLGLPMIRVHEDISECDPLVIEKLKSNEVEDEEPNSIWNGLKNLDLN